MTEFCNCDVAIIGGGYAGSVLALHLARQLEPASHIVIVEPRAELGSGLAYSTTDETHCINVPARQLAVSGDAEDRFIDWLETRHPELVGHGGGENDPTRTFVQRRWFGDFVRDRLAVTLASSDVMLWHRRALATDARIAEGGLELSLADGAKVRTRRLAIATGHGIPARLSGVPSALHDAPEIIGDPWRPDALAGIAADDDVLIVGTGLTMADVTASLLARSHRGKIVALSRHGLLSRPSAGTSIPAAIDFSTWPVAPVSVYLRKLRREIEREGGSWREVFSALREQSKTLWSKLPVWEKQRFMRHLKCFYDAHRYRMAPALARRIEAARHRGQVEIVAGKLRGARRHHGGLLVEIAPRGSRQTERRRFRAIVNCTGPRQTLHPDPAHFLGALIARGLAYPDPLGLGLTVDGDCRVYGISRNVFALGPLTRERFADVVGAPEIMAQAEYLARILAGELAERCYGALDSDRRRATSNLR
ncbi:MAG TPA: FAD/NAD(P)-binding protein [Stellaceae bacterium]|nr:FAD/NAD(P)-binding protein [Stellaceae bacterium]